MAVENIFHWRRWASMSACLTLCSLAAFGTPVLLINGDFESGTTGWKLPVGQWRVEKGVGLEKSSALVFEIGADVKAHDIRWAETIREARFPVECGIGYRFEGWLKTDGLKTQRNRDFGLYFAAYDAHGKAVKSSVAVPAADNVANSEGWYRVLGETPVLPLEAVYGGLYFWSGQCVGKAYVDRLSVRPVALNPIDRLVVSAYRAEAWTGNVSFAAAYCVNPYKNPATELVAMLEYMSPTGKVNAVCSLNEGIASVTLPVTAFAFGKNEITLILGRKNGTELGRSSCFFRREASPMSRKVTFDSCHRTLVDGRHFFPLGMYWSWNDVTSENLSKYTKEGSFNCLVGYGTMDEAKMDLCQSFGVKVIASLSGWFKEIQEAGTIQKASEIDARYVRGRLRRFRTHPAVIAWYLADEVPAKYERVLAAKRDMVYELDPDHPTWIVSDKPDQVRDLIRGFDVVGTDPYPIGNHNSDERTAIAKATDWTRRAIKATYGFRPVWQVPQAFDWGYYRPNETNRVEVRMPTYAEIRSMTWQAIAAGANGIVYYSFFDLLKRDKWPKERTAGGWENVCAVAREVKEKESVLLSEPGPVVEDVPENLVCRTWKTSDGKVHLLVCNTTRTAVKGSVRIGGIQHSINLLPIGVMMREL